MGHVGTRVCSCTPVTVVFIVQVCGFIIITIDNNNTRYLGMSK